MTESKPKNVKVTEPAKGIKKTETTRHGITASSVSFDMTPLKNSSPIAKKSEQIFADEKDAENDLSNEKWLLKIAEEMADELESFGLPRVPTLYDGTWYCFDANGNWTIEPINLRLSEGDYKKNGWVYCGQGISEFLRMKKYSELSEAWLAVTIIRHIDNLLCENATPELSVQIAYRLGRDKCIFDRLKAENKRVSKASRAWSKPWCCALAEKLVSLKPKAKSPAYWKMIAQIPTVTVEDKIWELQCSGDGKRGELVAELISGGDEEAVMPEIVKYNTFRRYLSDAQKRFSENYDEK